MSKIEQVRENLARAMTLTNSIKSLANRESQITMALRLVNDAVALRVRGTGPTLKRVVMELNSALSAVQHAPTKHIRLDFSELRKAQNDLARIAAEQENPDEEQSESQITENEVDFASAVFQAHSREAPDVKLGSRPFAVYRVPLVAISQPIINTDALNQSGIQAERVSEYPIIHDQLVIGVSHNKNFKEKVGRKTATSMDKALGVAEMIGRTKRVNMVLVTNRPYPYKGATWYWFADEPTLNRLMRAARGRLNITQWGFAFN